MQRVRDYLVYVVVRVLICMVQAMRIETGHRIVKRLAWLFADVLRVRGGVVDENLRHAFPHVSEEGRHRLARQMWEHLFLLVLEVAHAPRKIHETNWRRFVRLSGIEPLVASLLSDRPTIVVTGHFGNFELGGYILGLLGFPTHSVARTLDNPYLHQFLDRFRQVTGQYMIPKNGGYDQILDVLQSGGAMTFLADQAAGPKDCWVEFFGRPASTHKAIALLALQHEAPIAVSYAIRLERPMRFAVAIGGVADPREAGDQLGSIRGLTQWYTSQLEEAIRRAPGQYWWVHRRWKDRPSRRRARGKRAA